MVHKGSWGTPDLGISEWLADRLGIPRNAQGGSETGIVGTTGLINNGVQDYAPDYQQAATKVSEAQKLAAARTGDTLGATTTTLNNSPTTTTTEVPGMQTEEDLYRQRVQNAQNSLSVLLNNIQTQLGLAANRKGNIQGQLDTSYWGGNDQVGSLNPTGGLIGSNLAKKASELGLLDEKQGLINDLYLGNEEKGQKGYYTLNEENRQRVLDTLDKNAANAGAEADRVLGTNARKFQDTNTLNRVLAKARGMGGSSVYGNTQNKARYQAETLNKEVNADKADKIFQTGIEKGEQNNWYDTKDSELKSEYGNKSTAIKGEKFDTEKFHNDLDTQYRGDYKAAWDDEEITYNSNASNLLAQEQIFGIDNADKLDQLYAEHLQRRDAIADYASKQGQKSTEITNDVRNKQSTINNRSSLNNIKSTLENNKAVDTMNSGKLSDVYSTKIADNTANQNSLNAVLASMKDIGLPQEANASATMNIRRPNSLLDEKDKYGYLINNLFGKAYA